MQPEVVQQLPWRKALPLPILLGLVCVAQCTDIPTPTRVNITLDAPDDLRARIAEVEVEVSGAFAQVDRSTVVTKRLAADTGWPLRWTIGRADPNAKRYVVSATASDASGARIANVRAVGEFRAQETVQLALSFDVSCGGPCPDGKTCAAGSCIDPQPVAPAAGPAPAGMPAPQPAAMSGDAGAACSGGCTAVLTELKLGGATLDPAFDPNRSDYTLNVGLISDRVVLTPAAASGVAISLDGEVIPSGEAFQPGALRPGVDTLLLSVSAPGYESTTYRLQVQRAAAQTASLSANPERVGAHFGHALALDGDTLASAAVDESSDLRGVAPTGMPNDRAKSSGAVHVFTRAGARWSEQAYLKPSDTAPGQQFGTSLALAGDTLVVGAMHDSDLGAVYVFERAGSVWRERVKLTAPDRQSGAQFGQSVALQGDTLVVGASGIDTDSGINDVGAAYVWKRGADAASWNFVRRIQPDKPSVYAWFGSSVRLGGRYLVIGATGEGGSSSGVAYVFDAESFAQRAVLKPSAAGPAGFFGQLSAISGETIAVTAFNGNAGLTSGTVYIYAHTHDDEFPQQAALQASNASAGDSFGSGIALSGSVLVVGAAHEGSGARGIDGDLSAPGISNSGAAYVFARAGNTFTQIARLKASDPGSDDEFGWDVAVSGEDVIVGAHGVAHGTGALYVFH